VGPRFAGAYLVLILFALVTMGLLSMLRVPAPSGEAQAVPNRPLREIARQPRFVVAVLCGSVGFGVMNFLMTSTPISMKVCGHPYGDAAFVISSHVVGMFGPSFFTGGLIRRFGVIPILFAGVALNVGAVAIALSGVSVAQFWWALVLLGVGWNFLYIGGTALLTDTYRPEERAVAQGANESATFGMMVLSSLASGMIVTSAGWEKVNLAALPLIAVVLVAVGWLWLRERAPRSAGA
jgi:MFS family permease